jgi:hypothetical protein
VVCGWLYKISGRLNSSYFKRGLKVRWSGSKDRGGCGVFITKFTNSTNSTNPAQPSGAGNTNFSERRCVQRLYRNITPKNTRLAQMKYYHCLAHI